MAEFGARAAWGAVDDPAFRAARARQRRERLFMLASPLFIILVWEILARLNWVDVRFFPPPSRIAVTFWHMLLDGSYFHALGISLARIGVGFLIGAVPGLVLGVVMGLAPTVRAIVSPLVAAFLPIPKLALLPLILLIFGIGELSKWMTIASGVFFFVLMDTMAGVLNIDAIYLDVARNYGARRLDFFFTVALPGALPMIFNGLKLGMGIGLLLIVAAEMIGANSGIGYMIWEGYSVLALEQMYVGLITMAFLGYLLSVILDELERVVVPWKRH